MERGLRRQEVSRTPDTRHVEWQNVWEITSIREREFARIDDQVIDAGFAIVYLDAPAKDRLALISAFLNGQSVILDNDKEVAITWDEKELLLSTPLAHVYATQMIRNDHQLSELFYNRVDALTAWMVTNPSESKEHEQLYPWQKSPAFLESEALVAIYNLVVADYVKRLLASELPE